MDYIHDPVGGWKQQRHTPGPQETHSIIKKMEHCLKSSTAGYYNICKSKTYTAAAAAAAAAAKSLQSCPTLCDPIDGSPPGSPVPGILQARTLEWVAISFSDAWKWKVKVKSLSRVRLLATPWTAAYLATWNFGALKFCF